MNNHDMALLTAGAVAEGYVILLIWFIWFLVDDWRSDRRRQLATTPAKSED